MEAKRPIKDEEAPSMRRRTIRIPQAAEESGLAIGSLRKWVAEGKIPHFKVGRAVLLDAEEFQAWLRRTRIGG
jgi:excisionase family DNA binding protein